MITYPHILHNSTITSIEGAITYMRYGNPNTSYNMKLSELKLFTDWLTPYLRLLFQLAEKYETHIKKNL